MTLTANGDIEMGEKKLGKLQKNGQVIVNDKVILTLNADGSITSKNPDLTAFTILKDGSLQKKGVTFISIDENGKLTKQGDSDDRWFRFEGDKKAFRAASLVFLLSQMMVPQKSL